VGVIPALSLAPSRETLYPSASISFREMLVGSMEREALDLPEEAAHRLEELILGDAEALESRQYFDRLDLYRPLLHPDSGSAIDLLGEEGLLLLDEPLELDAVATRAEEELAQALEARANRGEILHSTANDFMLPPEHLAGASRIVSMSAMNALPSWLELPTSRDLGAVSLAPYRGLG